MAEILEFTKKPVGSADMSAERTDTCANCAFALFDPKNPELGTCRGRCPQIIVIPRPNALTGQMALSIESYFPMIQPKMWCGDFQPLDELDDEQE